MFAWKILELFEDAKSARYLITANDGENTVQSEGHHVFLDGTVNKPLAEIVESDLIQWIEKDTTINDVNIIKYNLMNQLNSLKNSVKKVDLPWLAGTFTIE